MSDDGSDGSGGGNSNSPPKKVQKTSEKEESDVKRPSGAKKWTFTWNNYPEDWMAQLAPVFEGCQWIAGEEVAPTTGTPHIQGYVEFPVKVRPIGYKGAPKTIHWGDDKGKPARGTREANTKYCIKEGKAVGTIKVPRPLPEITLYGWQLEAKAQLESQPDDRSIYWWWSKHGKKGKSSFVRWAVREGALVCSGKAADMKYLIVKYKEKHGDWPEVVIFDVPRSSAQYLSYTGIEEIKNGVFASTKYECDVVEMPYPHVFVMANFAPDLEQDDEMSVDRWICTEIA